MRSATSSIRALRGRGSVLLGTGLAAAVLAAAGVWWSRPPAALITTGQVLALMPAGSALHSLVRFDLDRALPLEAAAVVGIPPFPGAENSGYTEVIVRYNRWRHRLDVVYRRPLTEGIPVSVDAGRILGERDGALFQALRDDARWSYRVVGLARGRVAILAAGVSADRIMLADPMVIDRGGGRALAWNGSRFAGTAMPPVAAVPPTLTWRFRFHSGTVVSHTNQVSLAPRQTLRVQPVGGGTTPIVIADPRLDVVENGFRARQAGVYSIRVLAAYTPTENAYVLRVLVK